MGAVDTTYTFTATDTITSSKMNNIIDQTKMTAEAIDGESLQIVSPGKIRVKAGGIGPNELASNAVTEFKIKNGSVTTAKIADSTSPTTGVTTAKIADNAVTGAKLANSSIVASNLNSGQTGTAPIIAARATLQLNRNTATTYSSTYTSIPVTMSINTSVSPSVVTVTSNTPHGYLVGEPFFIWIETISGYDYYVCSFVDEIDNTNSLVFKFKTTSTSIPVGTSKIYFIDPAKYNSINIKKVHTEQPVINDAFRIGSGWNSFFNFIQENVRFNATFDTPLSNVDNACVIGSDSTSYTEVFLNYFDFYSPWLGFVRQNINDDVVVYDKSFSVAVFA